MKGVDALSAFELAVVAEVALAMLLGGMIGLERELANKSAGFRTHMLVAGAAALLVGLGNALVAGFDAHSSSQIIRSDPIRIIEAVITGISFLGAGTIFRNRGPHVSGLTTAASLLFSGGIGVAVALRQWTIAVGATLLVLLVLRALTWLEKRVNKAANE